jgi:cytochrome P450
MLTDLFVAGSETTATTLSWAYMYLAEYPDIQEKCYKEIEKVRLVTLCGVILNLDFRFLESDFRRWLTDQISLLWMQQSLKFSG